MKLRRRWTRLLERAAGWWTLRALGYRGLRYLGQGKDGPVYRGERGGRAVVAKALTGYARGFLHMTRALAEAKVEHPALPSFRVVAGRAIEYDDEPLVPVRPYPRELLGALIEVCSLEEALIGRNLVLWDLGNSAMNYMRDARGRLRWIDLGGNSFLFLAPPPGLPPAPRRNLGAADPRFLRLAVLIHVAIFGLGLQRLAKWATRVQDDASCFDRAEEEVLAALRGTLYAGAAEAASRADLRTVEGWRELRRALEAALAALDGGAAVLEAADVAEVRREGEAFQVRGYQSFDVGPGWIRALEAGHAWAPSYRKWEAVDRLLSALGVREYLDVGSNLGMHVFSAAIRQKASAHGLDYNPEYVRLCERINGELGLGCSFRAGRYSEIEGRFECVSMLGLIHHLYHRTEEYSDLEPILRKLASLCAAYAIVEFPTEEDPKARQWTGMPGRPRSRPYGLEEFLRAARASFSSVEKVDEVASGRPLFLLKR